MNSVDDSDLTCLQPVVPQARVMGEVETMKRWVPETRLVVQNEFSQRRRINIPLFL